jgi:ssDNA-binding Zn-finger/Zn-ribbon topoisomerase 1
VVIVKESNLKIKMLEYAPELANDYKEFVIRLFKSMFSDLGPSLKGIYSSRTWNTTFYEICKNLTKGDIPKLSYRETEDLPYYIDKMALEKNAKRYGEDTSLAWYDKMQYKLGDLNDVDVTPPNNTGYVTITGNYKDNKVRIEQQRIINQSSRGLLFHQFPSRIYVNDQAQSELQYKKTLHGWNVSHLEKIKIITQYKCNHCGYVGVHNDFKDIERRNFRILGLVCPKCRHLNVSKIEDPNKKPKIDPLTRPLKFKFKYKKEFIGTSNTPQNYGRIDEEENYPVSASNEKEAIDKITKSEMRYDSYKRVFDFDLQQVRSWNEIILWRKGDSKPVPVSSFKSKSQLKKEKKNK